MPYRVASKPISRRICLAVLSGLCLLAVLSVIFSNRRGAQPADVAAVAAWLAWSAVFGVRGWRCATLFASGRQVIIRGLVTTTSIPWQQIDGFVAGGRPVPVMTGLPIRRQRTVIGVRLVDGQTRWFPDLSCRPADDGSSWVDVSVMRLNELLGLQAPAQD